MHFSCRKLDIDVPSTRGKSSVMSRDVDRMQNIEDESYIGFLKFVPNIALSYHFNSSKEKTEDLHPFQLGWQGVVLIADVSGFTRLSENFSKGLGTHRDVRKVTRRASFKGEKQAAAAKLFRHNNKQDANAFGAEVVRKFVNRVFCTIIRVAEEYGGDVIRIAGDAVIIVFAPNTKNWDEGVDLAWMCHHATKCALTILEEQKKDVESGLSVHIGLACGKMNSYCVGGENNIWQFLVAGEPYFEVGDALDIAGAWVTVVTKKMWKQLREVGWKAVKVKDTDGYYRITETPDEDPASFDEIFSLMVGADHQFFQHQLKNKAEENTLSDITKKALWGLTPLPVRASPDSEKAGILSEEKTISILFVLLELKLDHDEPAKVLRDLQEVFTVMLKIAQRFEGIVKEFSVDDKGMVFIAGFGLSPYQSGGHAPRAALAALNIERQIQHLGGKAFMGVSTGQVIWASIGSNDRKEFAFISDTVNLAARLMVARKKMVQGADSQGKTRHSSKPFENKELVYSLARHPPPEWSPDKMPLPAQKCYNRLTLFPKETLLQAALDSNIKLPSVSKEEISKCLLAGVLMAAGVDLTEHHPDCNSLSRLELRDKYVCCFLSQVGVGGNQGVRDIAEEEEMKRNQLLHLHTNKQDVEMFVSEKVLTDKATFEACGLYLSAKKSSKKMSEIERLSRHLNFSRLQPIWVKGKSEPIDIFAPLYLSGDIDHPELDSSGHSDLSQLTHVEEDRDLMNWDAFQTMLPLALGASDTDNQTRDIFWVRSNKGSAKLVRALAQHLRQHKLGVVDKDVFWLHTCNLGVQLEVGSAVPWELSEQYESLVATLPEEMQLVLKVAVVVGGNTRLVHHILKTVAPYKDFWRIRTESMIRKRTLRLSSSSSYLDRQVPGSKSLSELPELKTAGFLDYPCESKGRKPRTLAELKKSETDPNGGNGNSKIQDEKEWKSARSPSFNTKVDNSQSEEGKQSTLPPIIRLNSRTSSGELLTEEAPTLMVPGKRKSITPPLRPVGSPPLSAASSPRGATPTKNGAFLSPVSSKGSLYSDPLLSPASIKSGTGQNPTKPLPKTVRSPSFKGSDGSWIHAEDSDAANADIESKPFLDLPEILKHLEFLGFLTIDPCQSELFEFSNFILVDAIYHTIETQHRIVLHEAAARWIWETYPESRITHLPFVIHHYTMAYKEEKATICLLSLQAFGSASYLDEWIVKECRRWVDFPSNRDNFSYTICRAMDMLPSLPYLRGIAKIAKGAKVGKAVISVAYRFRDKITQKVANFLEGKIREKEQRVLAIQRIQALFRGFKARKLQQQLNSPSKGTLFTKSPRPKQEQFFIQEPVSAFRNMSV